MEKGVEGGGGEDFREVGKDAEEVLREGGRKGGAE